jgi:hypothetical protein
MQHEQQLIAAIQDIWDKATPYGSGIEEGGETYVDKYLLPAGPLHRAKGLLVSLVSDQTQVTDHEALEKAYDAAGRSWQFHASLTEDERLRYAISAFLSSLNGHKLMPREPTEEMIRAAKDAAFMHPSDYALHWRAMFDAALHDRD